MNPRHRIQQRGAFLLLDIAAVAAAVGVLVTVFWGAGSGPRELGGITRGAAAETCCAYPPSNAASRAPVERLVVPSIGLDAAVIEMWLDDRRQMEIPTRPDVVAWYGFTARPGSPGNAVFAAHVNWHDGAPAAFEDLEAVGVGDEVRLIREDGTTLRYRVNELKSVVASGDASSVLIDHGGPTLTLITCQGDWDSVQAQYAERLVVSAELWP